MVLTIIVSTGGVGFLRDDGFILVYSLNECTKRAVFAETKFRVSEALNRNRNLFTVFHHFAGIGKMIYWLITLPAAAR